MGYLDHCLQKMAEKVPVNNPLKKLLRSPRVGESHKPTIGLFANMHIFPTAVFRMAEEDIEKENQEIETRNN